MNARLLCKTLFLIAILGLLVLMGMNNRSSVEVAFTPLLPNPIKLPAALMYFAFFGVGLLTGTVLAARGAGANQAKGGK